MRKKFIPVHTSSLYSEEERLIGALLSDPDFEPGDLFDTPTDAAPGSEEKIRVLCRRASQLLPLWSPGDRTCFREPHAAHQWREANRMDSRDRGAA